MCLLMLLCGCPSTWDAETGHESDAACTTCVETAERCLLACGEDCRMNLMAYYVGFGKGACETPCGLDCERDFDFWMMEECSGL